MSKLIKFYRPATSNYIDVFMKVSDRQYFTQLCSDTFSRITGVHLAPGETKIIRMTEVKNALKKKGMARDRGASLRK